MAEPTDDRAARPLLARLAFTLVWAGPLFALWLALVDKSNLWENVVGICCALVAGAAAEAAGLFGRVRFRPRLRWLAWAARAPWWIVHDSAIVLAALVREVVLRRPVIGTTTGYRVAPGGEDGVAVARRALAKGLGSTGPNSIALGIDDDVLVVHRLDPEHGEVPPADLMNEP
jgi:hypothetical protein